MTENDVFSLESFIMAPYSYIHKTKASLPGTNIKLKGTSKYENEKNKKILLTIQIHTNRIYR